MDPASLQVLISRLSGIADEMGAVLRRSAFSPNIKERADCSAALFTASGELLAQAEHIPVHLGSMPASVQAAIDAGLPWSPGDQIVLNDPFAGGTHLNDITLVAPCVVDGRLVGWAANRAHHADVGGMAPGSIPPDAVTIQQEGLRIPPVLLSPGVVSLLLANSRTPDERRGDLDAQVGANVVGVARLTELASSSFADFDEVVSYGERRMRAALSALPDGTWTFTDVLDSVSVGDGGDRGATICVSLTIDGASATFDFTGTSPQSSDGNVNAVSAVTISCVAFALRSAVDPTLPANGGTMRAVDVVAPPGSIVAARFPAAVGAGNVEVSQRVADVCLGALAQVLPDRVGAASQGTMNNVLIGGSSGWVYYETVAGGQGARPLVGGVGMSGVHTAMTNTRQVDPPSAGQSGIHTNMTNTRDTPVEALERAYPMRIRRYSLRRGSGGAGLARGGDGVVKEWEFLEDVTVSLVTERRVSQPWGLAGGEPGTVGENWVLPGGDEARAERLPDKCTVHLQAGDVLRMLTPGGGGWGPAADRAVGGVTILGEPRRGPVELAEYDPSWSARFLRERDVLGGALGSVARRIEHIGSTSVPGLSAKAIIDIAVSVDDPDDDASVLPAMTAAGYTLRVIEPGHRMYRPPSADVHVHFWRAGSDDERRHLLFPDWLRVSAEDRSRYERVKRELAPRAWADRNDYADAKSDVVADIMGRAAGWAAATGWVP